MYTTMKRFKELVKRVKKVIEGKILTEVYENGAGKQFLKIWMPEMKDDGIDIHLSMNINLSKVIIYYSFDPAFEPSIISKTEELHELVTDASQAFRGYNSDIYINAVTSTVKLFNAVKNKANQLRQELEKSIITLENWRYVLGVDNKNKIPWSWASYNYTLSEEFIRKFQNKVDWWWISRYQKLSESFIEEFQDKVDWDQISQYQKLSYFFILKHSSKIDWLRLSKNRKLSEDLIWKLRSRMDFNSLIERDDLSLEFKEKLKTRKEKE